MSGIFTSNEFRFAFNTAPHSSLKLSPAFLNFGRFLNPADSLWREIEGQVAIHKGDVVSCSERMERLQNLRDWVAEKFREAHEI